MLRRELLPRLVEVDLPAVGDRLDHRFVEVRVADRPRDERALRDRERRIGHEQIRVDLLLRAEPGAPRARAVRRVEREDPRLELGERDAVLGAGEPLGERQLLAVDDVDDDEPLGERDRGLDRLPEPRAQIGLHHQPVDDHLDRVLELLVERDLVLEEPLLAVDLDAREPLGAQVLEQVPVLALPVADDRGVDREPRPFGEPQHLVDDRLDRLSRDRPAADRAVRPPDARVEQAQVVVDLRDGADGRPRVPRRRLLVDRDRRREPVDRVHVRLLHHLEELPRVRGERLHVASLSLRVDRVEGKARLPRAGQPGDADQLVPGQPDGDVLEVVLPRAVDYELVGRHVATILAIEQAFA